MLHTVYVNIKGSIIKTGTSDIKNPPAKTGGLK